MGQLRSQEASLLLIVIMDPQVSRADAGASWRRPGPVTRDPYPSIPT